jgi:hypothetical protein
MICPLLSRTVAKMFTTFTSVENVGCCAIKDRAQNPKAAETINSRRDKRDKQHAEKAFEFLRRSIPKIDAWERGSGSNQRFTKDMILKGKPVPIGKVIRLSHSVGRVRKITPDKLLMWLSLALTLEL